MGSTSKRNPKVDFGVAVASALALAATVGTVAVNHSNTSPAGNLAATQLTAADSAAHSEAVHPAVYLVASLEGRNEVQVAGKPRVGAPNGQAVEVIRIQGDKLSYTVSWRGIGEPTEGHIHVGVRGVNGSVVVPLFMSPRPAGTNWASGTVTVTDPKLLAGLRESAGGFYANLHTAQFPGGALRGQLHRVDRPVRMSRDGVFQASVVRGAQIYACTPQRGGGYAFTQDDVAAVLRGGILHSFVRPKAGPPQWRALDGSAVTGTVVVKTSNGTGNIPELDLWATPAGARHGLLSRVDEVLRLNTVGGAAPTGSCNPSVTPTVAVPYQADYVFVN
jgi:hypothetical protein